MSGANCSSKLQLWLHRFDQFNSGHVTVKQFCESVGCSTPTFYYWKRKAEQLSSVCSDKSADLCSASHTDSHENSCPTGHDGTVSQNDSTNCNDSINHHRTARQNDLLLQHGSAKHKGGVRGKFPAYRSTKKANRDDLTIQAASTNLSRKSKVNATSVAGHGGHGSVSRARMAASKIDKRRRSGSGWQYASHFSSSDEELSAFVPVVVRDSVAGQRICVQVNSGTRIVVPVEAHGALDVILQHVCGYAR